MKKFLPMLLFSYSLIGVHPTAAAAESVQAWDVREYIQNATLQEKWAAKFFLDHHPLNRNERILDIGSGDGKLTSILAASVPHGEVVGIDHSESMVNHANTHYDKHHFPNLSFVLADAANPSFYWQQNNKFDIAVSFTALHWVKNQTAVLKNVASVLKPGGQIFFRLCSDGEDPIQIIADNLIKQDKWKRYFTDFTDPMTRFSVLDYKQLLQESGFINTSVHEISEDDILDSYQDLFKMTKSWLPHAKHLPKEKQEAFLNEIVATYKEKYPLSKDGKIHLYDHYLEVHATMPKVSIKTNNHSK